MEREKATMRDWSSLPPEVLNLIAKDLTEVPDFVRFRAVCTAWRNSAPVTDLPPQFPWILQTYRDENDANMRFYSMTFGNFYTIPDPIPMDLWPYEVSEGYLFARVQDLDQNTSSLSLLNPLNNDVIPFPACIGAPGCFGQRYNQIGKYGLCLHRRGPEDELIHCQLGQNQWCELKRDDSYSKYRYFYLKGMLFALHISTGVTKVTNISTGSLAYVIPSIGDPDTVQCSTFLESSGDILGVFTVCDGLGDYLWEVHYLDLTESGSPFWVKIKNIGNRAIFEDVNGAFVLEANDLIGIKANCIYYLHPNYRHTQTQKPFSEVKRFDLQTGVEENLLRRTISNPDVCWFVPNLCHLREQ